MIKEMIGITIIMKLEKFKEKNSKKNGIVIGSIVLVLFTVGVILYRSFAFFEEEKSFNIIKGQVPNQNDDMMLSMQVIENGNATVVKSIPEGKNYTVQVTCNGESTGYWDYESWHAVIDMKEVRTKCNLTFTKQYREEILHGTDPVLSNGLIPVTIENDGTVKKADVSTEWYDYQTQKWANAVILEDKSVSYQNNEVIPEDNIESYFVWIPRYKYKIFNDGNYSGLTSIEKKEQTIDVIFETKDAEVSNGSAVGEYLTHPAFTSFGTNGLWVGKFETGYKGATNTGGAESNTYDTEKVEIKPNVYSWRNIQVVNAHKNSYNYKREYDSHMMKNTEWGAVAYLQHSLYGSRKSVRINNNSSYITGYGAVAEPTCGYTADNRDCNKYESTNLNSDGTYTKRYNTEEGNAASTVGNITGIYDMSGGAWEYVMGVMTYSNGTLCAGANLTNTSGFTGTCCENGGSASGEAFPAEKYYDKYAYSTSNQQYQKGILGDATKEMGPFANVTYVSPTRQISSWYADEAWFVWSGYPWFGRGEGCNIGSGAGVFAFDIASGGALTGSSFRIVLAI